MHLFTDLKYLRVNLSKSCPQFWFHLKKKLLIFYVRILIVTTIGIVEKDKSKLFQIHSEKATLGRLENIRVFDLKIK